MQATSGRQVLCPSEIVGLQLKLPDGLMLGQIFEWIASKMKWIIQRPFLLYRSFLTEALPVHPSQQTSAEVCLEMNDVVKLTV